MVIAAPANAPTPFVPALQAGDVLPRTVLVDQRGRRFSIGGSANDATVVTFFYARCRDADECPLTSAKFARLQHAFAREPVRLVEITLDPQHDTIPVLARYAASFGANPDRWHVATAAPADVDMLARRLGIAVSRARGGAFVHEDAVVVLDATGRVADTIGGAWSTQDLDVAVGDVLRVPVDPFARARFALTRGIAAACGGAAGRRGFSLAGAGAIFAATFAAIGLCLRSAVPKS